MVERVLAARPDLQFHSLTNGGISMIATSSGYATNATGV
jgi:hypothetical protein